MCLQRCCRVAWHAMQHQLDIEQVRMSMSACSICLKLAWGKANIQPVNLAEAQWSTLLCALVQL